MSSWEEIFTSSNPAGGRMINVISGAAGSDASPYTANNPAGGRAINVNLIGGGTVGTGFLQITGGVLDTTLRNVTDNSATPVVSPLQLSTTQVQVTGTSDVPSVNVGIFKVLGSATNALVFGTTTSSPFGAYIQGGGSARYPLLLNPLLNANAGVSIGKTTNGAALDVKGDGTNPIALFENGAGQASVTFNQSSLGANVNFANACTLAGNTGTTSFTSSLGSTIENVGQIPVYRFTQNTDASTTNGVSNFFTLSKTIAPPAGAASFRNLILEYTINASGAQSGTATGIFLNATETALNGMTHNLMDLGTGGGSYVSRFVVGRIHDVAFRFNNIAAANNWRPLYSISRVGEFTPALSFGVGSGATGSSAYIASSNDDLFLGTDTSNIFTTNIILKANSVGFIGLGGLTADFPAIKRNSAAIDFRTADDTGFCNVRAATINCVATIASSYLEVAGNMVMSASEIYAGSIANARINVLTGGVNIQVNGSTLDTSAIFQLNSTTKGFLPPRMDDAQRAAITAPAVGLIVYQTNGIEGLYIYKSTGWTFVI